MWNSGKPDNEKLEILLSYSFERIINDKDLLITLLQLAKNYFGLNHSTCKKDHYLYYNKLKAKWKDLNVILTKNIS